MTIAIHAVLVASYITLAAYHVYQIAAGM